MLKNPQRRRRVRKKRTDLLAVLDQYPTPSPPPIHLILDDRGYRALRFPLHIRLDVVSLTLTTPPLPTLELLFPSLVVLHLTSDHPVVLPPLRHLRALFLDRTEIVVVENAPLLQQLECRACPMLVRVSGIPSIEVIDITGSPEVVLDVDYRRTTLRAITVNQIRLVWREVL